MGTAVLEVRHGSPQRLVRDLHDFDVLILPGWKNSGPEHWQTHWESAFPHMRRVLQADWDAPRYADWATRLTAAVAGCRSPVLLVAHSLGTALVTRWAQESDTRAIAGAFLVAATDMDRFEGKDGNPYQGFAPLLLKPLPFPAWVIASRNDERVDFERARAFANAWGAHCVDAGLLGHMGSASRLGVWPQGLVWFGQFIASLGGQDTRA